MQKTKTTLVILQRDNFTKDKGLIDILGKHLKSVFEDIRYFEPYATHDTSVFLDPTQKLNKFPTWFRKPYKAFLLLKYPSRWSYYFSWYKTTEVSIENRCRKLKEYICSIRQEYVHHEHVQGNKNNNGVPENGGVSVEVSTRVNRSDSKIIVLARSSGGRISSLVADEVGIDQIVCLGYPFKHPEKSEEVERYLHLKNTKTPMLIFQGIHDEYGGLDILQKYSFSPAVKIEFLDTDHDFKISEKDIDKIAEQIKSLV